jgi:hypothetical protein
MTVVTFANNSMQGDNLTSDLKARGLSGANSIKTIYANTSPEASANFRSPTQRLLHEPPE